MEVERADLPDLAPDEDQLVQRLPRLSSLLVRFGKLFRGMKVRNAQERGAAAVLLFSDPADDGYGAGDLKYIGFAPSGSG